MTLPEDNDELLAELKTALEAEDEDIQKANEKENDK